MKNLSKKYAVLLGDGMADYPLRELNGKTPLEHAFTPNMDAIATQGVIGLVDTIPESYTPGSDVANLTVLGYDVRQCYSGRGPLEAANMGIKLAPADVAFRCNLVTLGAGYSTMEEYNAGHISSQEAREIIEDLDKKIGGDEFQFYPGVSYRHLMVWRNGIAGMETKPPHDITGQPISGYLPSKDGSESIIELMHSSWEILRDHPVNRARLSAGKKPANSIWLWGQGRAPKLLPLTEKYGISGGMISAVDLLNGIGVYAGLEVIRVPGATGYIDTNYHGKAEKALESLQSKDFIFIHVEAPDEMGHAGNLDGKIKAIEDFDEKVVGTVLKGIRVFEDYHVMVLCDHPTPISLKTHSSDPSPFAMLSSLKTGAAASARPFSEASAKSSGNFVSPGYLLMDRFIEGSLFG